MKKTILLSLTAFIIATSCEKAPEEIAVTSVVLSQATAEMIIGETVQLKETVLPNNATDKTVTWASSKQSVASVSDSGLITAISEGVTSIVATAGGVSASCQVTVLKGFVEVTSVRLNATTLNLKEDEQATLEATVLPEDATNQHVEWSSSEPSVASVLNGIVYAHKNGTSTISAKSGKHSATCVVNVRPKAIVVSEIMLNENKLVLIEGEEAILEATVKPDNATDKTIVWTSSDESVAKVSSSGKVSAIASGAAIITAKSGEKQAVCLVEVHKRIPVSSVTLNRTTLTLEKGETEILVATVLPNDATDNNITWTSSNPGIVSVSDGLVKAVAGGNAIITASAGGQTAICDVSVIVSVTSIVLNETTLMLVEGQSSTLTATVSPSDATDKTVTWLSEKPDVASVVNGKVTASHGGQTTITASAGARSASCVISVLSEKELDLSHKVTVNTNPGYGISLLNGKRYYLNKVTIYNKSIVDIYVSKIESPNCPYYSYESSSGSFSFPEIVGINSSVGTIKAGKSFELELYCTQYSATQNVTIHFTYNGHNYFVTN